MVVAVVVVVVAVVVVVVVVVAVVVVVVVVQKIENIEKSKFLGRLWDALGVILGRSGNIFGAISDRF